MSETISITNNGVKPYIIRVNADLERVSESPQQTLLRGGQSTVLFTEYVKSIQIGPAT